MARRWPAPVRRRLAVLGTVAAILPWALFVLWSAAPTVMRSIAGLERFPDTGNAGYFIVKSALVLLVVLAIAQALSDLRRPRDEP
jgi:TRAP-type mannitol/chloroaromatic compound transport system permease small subunit